MGSWGNHQWDKPVVLDWGQTACLGREAQDGPVHRWLPSWNLPSATEAEWVRHTAHLPMARSNIWFSLQLLRGVDPVWGMREGLAMD